MPNKGQRIIFFELLDRLLEGFGLLEQMELHKFDLALLITETTTDQLHLYRRYLHSRDKPGYAFPLASMSLLLTHKTGAA